MATVEQAHVVAQERVQETGRRALIVRRQQQMDVITHQHVRVQRAAEAQQAFAQALQVAPTILIVQKTGQPVVAALHDVLRNAGQIQSGKSCHGHKLLALRCPHLSVSAACPSHLDDDHSVGNCP